jgi:hypothetical protein
MAISMRVFRAAFDATDAAHGLFDTGECDVTASAARAEKDPSLHDENPTSYPTSDVRTSVFAPNTAA